LYDLLTYNGTKQLLTHPLAWIFIRKLRHILCVDSVSFALFNLFAFSYWSSRSENHLDYLVILIVSCVWSWKSCVCWLKITL